MKKKQLQKILQTAVDDLRDLTLVGKGVIIDPDTGKVTSPDIVHMETKLKGMKDKVQLLSSHSLFFEAPTRAVPYDSAAVS